MHAGRPSSFSSHFADLDITYGQTIEGDPCKCTGPAPTRRVEHKKHAKSQTGIYKFWNVLGAAKDADKERDIDDMSPSEVAAFFAMKNLAAGANNDLAAQSQALLVADKQYHEAVEKARDALASFESVHAGYGHAYEIAQEAYNKYCKPQSEKYGTETDCKLRWNKMVDRFLSRIHYPDCLVGERVVLGLPREARGPDAAIASVIGIVADSSSSSGSWSTKLSNGRVLSRDASQQQQRRPRCYRPLTSRPRRKRCAEFVFL
mmetsp:Transcript_83403/g.232596  ORF Transcript_83403/g.232596 Transcript_83403/m.232596 type:complete len:261 (-) Transcript_83403:103-885(-)